MHKNRVIMVLSLLIILLAEGFIGLEPTPKKYTIEILSVVIFILAFLIERKGVSFLQWHKRNPVTHMAHTYIEHNGATKVTSDESVVNK